MKRGVIILMALPWLMALPGCGSDDGRRSESELQDWMAGQRQQLAATAASVLAPRLPDVEPADYDQPASRDPFSSQRWGLLVAAAGSTGSSARGRPNPLLEAELARAKEPLEAYPLSAMKMVGSMKKGGADGDERVALVQVGKLIYTVPVGAYIGQHYGKVQSITETDLVLREVVQNPAGEWVARNVTVQLMGSNA